MNDPDDADPTAFIKTDAQLPEMLGLLCGLPPDAARVIVDEEREALQKELGLTADDVTFSPDSRQFLPKPPDDGTYYLNRRLSS